MTTDGSATMSGSNEDVVREFYRAVTAKDGVGIKELIENHFSDDVTIVWPESLPYGGSISGAGKLARVFGRMAAATEPAGASDMVVVDVVDGGDRLAARLEFDWYAPGSKEAISTGALELWTFTAGRVSEIRAYYWDTAACAAHTAAVGG